MTVETQIPDVKRWKTHRWIPFETENKVREPYLNPEQHELVYKQIERHSNSGNIPWHYRLMQEIDRLGGETPQEIRDMEHITDERVAVLPGMVRDMCVGIARLEEAGYTILTTEDVNEENRYQIACDMAQTIRETYPHPKDENDTIYPLKESNDEATAKQMGEQLQDVFMAYDSEGNPVATFSMVTKKNVIDAPYILELGRTGVSAIRAKELKEKGLGLRCMLQLRTLHLWLNPKFVEAEEGEREIIAGFTDMRAAGITRTMEWDPSVITPSGEGVQGTFFGGIRVMQDLGYGIWGIGNQYKLGDESEETGGMEPFIRAGQWINPEKMEEELANKKILVPNEEAANIITAYMISFMKNVPEVVISENCTSAPNGEAYSEYNPQVIFHYNGENVFASIDVVDTQEELDWQNEGEIPEECVTDFDSAFQTIVQKGSPYVEFYVEAAINGGPPEDTQKAGAIMNKLMGIGAVVTGFTPSDKVRGGLKLTFSLMLPGGFKSGVVEPVFPEKYYTGNRLETAIHYAKRARQNMLEHSAHADVNANCEAAEKYRQ